MFIISIKQYIKTPSIRVITILYFIYLGYVLGTTPCVDLSYPFMVYMGQIKITFLFFLFVSYEFFSKSKREKIEEVLYTCKKGGGLAKLSGISIFVLLDALICIILLAFLYIVAYVQEVNEWKYFVYLLQCTLIHHFLIYLLAVLLGFLVSFVNSRTVGYGILMGTIFLMGHTFIVALNNVSFGIEALYRITDLLSLITREFYAAPNLYYMFSIEAVNMQRVLFWVLLTISILCVVMNCGRKRYLAVIPGISVLICAVLFFQPTSAAYVDVASGQDSWTADDAYYTYIGNTDDSNEVAEAGFKVSKYKMVFDVQRELKAEVEVWIDGNDLHDYDFTLYHGYKIKCVKDGNGHELPFEQKGDYATIVGDNLERLIFEYEGCCKRYYSTVQGVFLPAYLEYYPVPGKRPVYKNEYYYTGNTLEGLGYEVYFDIMINTKEKVYSNLEEIDKNHVSGTADGVTLFCSPFAAEMQIGQCRIIYPVLGYYGEKLKEQEELFTQFINKYQGDDSVAGKMILIPPEINGSFYYFGSDHLIGDIYMLSSNYDRYVTTGELYPYISEEELMEELEQIEQEE